MRNQLDNLNPIADREDPPRCNSPLPICMHHETCGHAICLRRTALSASAGDVCPLLKHSWIKGVSRDANLLGCLETSQLHELDIGSKHRQHSIQLVPSISSRFGRGKAGLAESAFDQITQADRTSKSTGQGMTKYMQSLIAGFGGDELHSLNAVRNGHTEGDLHPEKGFGEWAFHSVGQVMQLLINQCDLATYPHEQHVTFVLGGGLPRLRFRRSNPDRRCTGLVRSQTETKGHQPEKNCSDNSRKGGHHSPSVPPDYTPVLTGRPARTNCIPPAHSLIPLWTGQHSDMPLQRSENAHG